MNNTMIKFNNELPIPKTRAGQLFKGMDDTKIIKERLTSYGSMAIISVKDCFTIVKYDYFAGVYGFIVCHQNVFRIIDSWCNEI